ncbi:cytochrome P450 [Biscogniauxia marginata]|nr:cytochrome P450 [Biscogniauxia marginata]
MAFMAIALLLATATVINTGIRLLQNYWAARTIGVPIRIIPISPLNPLWVLLDRKVLAFFRRLPFGDNSFTRYRSHHEMGDIWVLVTPLKNWVYINNLNTLVSIFRRGTDFPRPVFVNEVLNVFGPNISTVEGQRWKTQRRIATHCFDEKNNEIVWSETISLARDMLRYWTSKTSIKSSAEDLRTLSLHTLSRAGFDKSFKFEGADERGPSTSTSSNYKDSLQTILENWTLILALGTKFLANPWLPHKFRVVHEAWVSFHAYMTSMYEDEKRALAEGKTTDHNLITLMVRASEGDEENPGALTESEIYGNMFAFNFAGHDTTANTFTFALHFLAAQLDSIMHETMRLYTPVPVIKWTGDLEQPLTVNSNKVFVLPPHSMVAPSYGSIQTDPKFWGPDSLTWRPSRWIKSANLKFSQVEFAPTMAVLFRDWRVDPVTFKGETIEAARERVMKLIETDSYAVLLLQMLHPERAPLVWRKA